MPHCEVGRRRRQSVRTAAVYRRLARPGARRKRPIERSDAYIIVLCAMATRGRTRRVLPGLTLSQVAPVPRKMIDQKFHLVGKDVAVGKNQMFDPAWPVRHGQQRHTGLLRGVAAFADVA